MDDSLPTEFDLIVIGTGLTESIVAAAASRVGKTVLHIDANDYYGGQWASFNLENIQSFVSACEPSEAVIENVEYRWAPDPITSTSTEDATNDSKTLGTNMDGEKVIDDATDKATVNSVVWTKAKVLSEFRKFNIDITPKLLFARGDLVELLISSNICRYAEFRAVDKIVTLLNGKVTAVPCSRADVFTNKNVNVVEKRLLMKALGNCLNANDDADTDAKFKKFGDKTFVEYLQSERLTPNLIHYVLYAIAMCDDQTSCAVGVKRTKQFLQSLGRYGNTPFLFPMYGCGEIPQCFCRLCAVFGGVYCLKRSIDTIRIDEVQNDFRSVSCGGQTINAKALVLGNGGRIGNAAKSIRFTANDSIETTPNEVNKCGQLARAIYIVTKPLGDESLNSGGGGVNILRLPGSSKTNDGAFVIQLAHYSGTCPKDLYLIHITCKASGTSPAQDIHPFERQLFDDTNENTILWSMYFNIPQCMKCQHSTDKNSANVHIACGPFFELDYDESIQQAKTTFNEIYPNDEFLPRAPDPEEIIIEGDAAPTTPTSETALVNSALIDGIDTLQIDATDSSMGHSDTTCTDTATSDTATSDTMGTDTATSDTTCTDSGTAGCDSGSTYCSDSYGDTSCGDSGGGSYD